MSNLFDDREPTILPKISFKKQGFIDTTSPIFKTEIIKEGEGKVARNANKLDLSNSIYEKMEDED